MELISVVTVVFMINLLHVTTGQEESLVDQLECYGDRILGCSGTPVLGVSSPRDCCLGDGYWYRLGSSRECMQCIDVIGFEHDTYSVSEEDGSVQVCAGLLSGTSKNPIHIILTTVDGSATDPTDYTSTTWSQEVNSIRRISSCMTIPVINDGSPEINEDFTVTLSLREDDSHAVFSAQNVTITITDDDVEPEPEKGCTVKVFVLAAMQEEMQMMVMQGVQNVLPNIFGIPLSTTEASTDKPTDPITTATDETQTTTARLVHSTARRDPVLSLVYTTLAKKFDKVKSDTGYTQFVEAVAEITEAHHEACSGRPDEQPTREDVPRLARQFAALSPNESQELRSIFGKMLCLRDRHSDRKKRQAEPVDVCDGVECPDGEFDAVTEWCQFFACLDDEIEERFGVRLEAVFGFIRDDLQCLAFVVDTTGSMRQEIQAVQDLILGFVSSEEPACYIITPFNDNSGYSDYPYRYDHETPLTPDFGPAMLYDAFDVAGLKDMLDDISDLMAFGGGDRPEYGMNGLQTALRTEWPWESSAMIEGSQVFLFTDAPAKDVDIMMDVIDEACARKVCIHLFLSTYETTGFEGYTTVAERTGGTIVRATATEFHDLVQIFGDFSTSYRGDSSCVTYYSEKNKRKRRSSHEQCHTFKVSTFTSVLKLRITTEQLQTTVQKPNGVKVTSRTIRGYGAYREVRPEPGEWSVCVENGTLSVSFNNRVLLDFLVTFVKEDERSPTHVVTKLTTIPPPACSTANVSILSSHISDIALARLNFVKDGNVVASAPLTSCSKAMVGTIAVPLGSFTYQLQGEDNRGNPFQVSGKTVNIKPGQYSLNTISTTTELKSGESTLLVFELHNQNSYGSSEFTIHVEATRDFSVALQQTHALLKAGDSTLISMLVFANSLPGNSTDITIVAYDGCITVTGSHTVTIVPLDFVVVYAEENICATSAMTTSVIPSACSSSDFAVFVPKSIPGISLTHLSFVQAGHTIARNPLSPCDTGALVGNATFPSGLITYQLQGMDVNGKSFSYESATVEFRPGTYTVDAVSTTGEVEAGEFVVISFELHNNNLYGSTHFSFSTESGRGLSAVPLQTTAMLEAGSSAEIGVHVSAGISTASQSKQFTLTANDGCTSVSASHTLSITAPEIPTADTNLCGCENGGTCVTIRRGRRTFHVCQCPSGYGGRVCQIVYN